MLVQYTFLEIQFNINALNTSIWIFILFMRKLLVDKYVSYMSPGTIILQIFLQKDFLWCYFRISGTVLVYENLTSIAGVW